MQSTSTASRHRAQTLVICFCKLAQDQAEEESGEECQPGPDEHSLDPSRDEVGCDNDKSSCDRLQAEKDQASLPDEALEYDTKL